MTTDESDEGREEERTKQSVPGTPETALCLDRVGVQDMQPGKEGVEGVCGVAAGGRAGLVPAVVFHSDVQLRMLTCRPGPILGSDVSPRSAPRKAPLSSLCKTLCILRCIYCPRPSFHVLRASSQPSPTPQRSCLFFRKNIRCSMCKESACLPPRAPPFVLSSFNWRGPLLPSGALFSTWEAPVELLWFLLFLAAKFVNFSVHLRRTTEYLFCWFFFWYVIYWG